MIFKLPTLRHLAPARFPEVKRVIVAYSGGKDSLVVTDLAVRFYGADRVVGFYLYFVDDMDLTRAIIAYAKERWGIEVIAYPHFFTSEYLNRGQFCAADPNVPLLKVKDIERVAKADLGAQWIAYGYRRSDSLERNAMLRCNYPGGVSEAWARLAPVAEFSRNDILLYCRRHDIVVPSEQEMKTRSSNVGLYPSSMWWLRKWWPKDYERVLKVFPYATLQADRYLDPRAQRPEKVRKKKGKGCESKLQQNQSQTESQAESQSQASATP